jgi:hypothetical protein
MRREQRRTSLREIGRQRDPGRFAGGEIGFLDERETALAQLRTGGARPIERLEPRQVYRTGHHARGIIQRMGVQQRRHTLHWHQKHQQQQGAQTAMKVNASRHGVRDRDALQAVPGARNYAKTTKGRSANTRRSGGP